MPDEASSRKRRPRAKRVPDEERPSMRLTERDCDIIRAVNDYRALRSDQIERLFFGSRSPTQYRLSRLWEHEYLEREFISVASSAPASNPAVYTVGKRGAQVLVDHFDYDRSDLRRPKKSSLGWHLLEHLLKVNDVRIAFAQAAASAEFTMETWWDETTFRAHPDYVTVSDKRGRPRKKPVFPDGYFFLSTPQGKARFFLEVDRGTETLSKFAPQIRVYEAYVASGQYQERFQAKSLRVLIVTTTPKRLESLMRVTEHVGGDRKYCFTTFDRLTKETALTGAIWRRIGDGNVTPLFEMEEQGN